MVDYIESFVEVCTNVFQELAGIELASGSPFFIGANTPGHEKWDISGVIGLSGDAWGAVAVSFKTDLAILLTDKLTGTQHTSLDGDVTDAVGELVNIIAGNAKEKLESSYNLVISLPSIVKESERAIAWSKEHAQILCLPFTAMEKYNFYLLVAIASSKGSDD
jgi:chemotaxis protein CheX